MMIDVEENDITPTMFLSSLENSEKHPIIIFDELDRFGDDDGLSLLADTIKAFSDHAILATIVLVGVADSIDQLIGDHLSVGRAIVQVKMPRMSMKELGAIIDSGLKRLHLTIQTDARSRIIQLSEGLPSYTHLLSYHSATFCVQDDRAEINDSDVKKATQSAIKKCEQSVLSGYEYSIKSARKDHLFREVLLACALCSKNELGYFSAGDVRHPMSRILKRDVKISAFSRHLNEFCSVERGAILQKSGQPRKYFYRFANPMLQPYVIIRGLTEKIIEDGILAELRPSPQDEQLLF